LVASFVQWVFMDALHRDKESCRICARFQVRRC
jgi:hypothetical protein